MSQVKMKSTSTFLFLFFWSSLINHAQSQLPNSNESIEKVINISKKTFWVVNSSDKRFLLDREGNKMDFPKGQVYFANDGEQHVLTGIIDYDEGKTQYTLLQVLNNRLKVKGTLDLVGYWTSPLLVDEQVYLTNMWEGSGNMIKVFDFELSEEFQIAPLDGQFFQQLDYGQNSSGVQAIIQADSRVYLINRITNNSTTKKELQIDQRISDTTFGSSMILM